MSEPHTATCRRRQSKGPLTKISLSGALLTAAASAQGVFLVDSSQDQLYAVDHYTAAVSAIGSTANNGLATPVDLTWRRVTQELWTVDRVGGEIGTLDTETATFTPVHATGMDGWDGLAWHELDGCFYLSKSDDNLYRFTPWNSQLTLLGPTGFSQVRTLDVDADNKLYGVAAAGPIVKLDTGSGAGLMVSSTTNSINALAIEPYSGRWYAIDGSYDTLERIDPATGATTLMGSITLPGFITLPRGLAFAARRDGGIVGNSLGDLFFCDFTTGTRHFLDSVPSSYAALGGVAYDPKSGGLWVTENDSSGFPQIIITTKRLDLSDGSWGPDNSVTTNAAGVHAALTFNPRFGSVVALKRNGSVVAGWPSPSGDLTLGLVGSIMLPEVRDIACDALGRLYCVRSNGEIFAVDGFSVSYVMNSVPGAIGLTVEAGTGHFLVHAGGRLYEVDRDTSAVTVRGSLASMGGGGGFSHLETLGHASAYVVDSNTDRLGSVDLQTGAATVIGSTLNHGLMTPADLTLQASTGELWTVDSDNGYVGFLDTATATFTPVFDLGTAFTGIAWHEGDNRFYLSNRNDNVYALELSGDLTLLGNTGVGEVASLDTDKNGNLIGITWGSGEMVVIDRVTGVGTLMATTTAQFQDVGIDTLTGDVYAVRHANDALYSIDPTTGASSIIGTFGPSFPVVRGFDLVDGYGSSLARTLLIGTACGGMSASTQAPPQLNADWELYFLAPLGTQFGGVAIGTNNPNLPLDSAGAPGCMLYNDLVDIVWLQMPFGSPSHTIMVPPVSDLAGFELYAQAFGYAPNANALNIVTSNGVYGRVGW